MKPPPTPKFCVVANPQAPSPQELVSHARIDQALQALTHARRGRWPQAQIVEVGQAQEVTHG